MSTASRPVALGLAAVTVAAGVLAPTAAAATPPARIVDLKPRVVDLRPRIVDLRPKHQKNKLTVNTDVLFAFDSAKLSRDATDVLADVVNTLKSKGPSTVTVAGYTDSIGSAGYNLRLSRGRAQAVTAYLKKHVGNPRLHYLPVGRGEKDPVAANKTPSGNDNPEGRRKNRRVTIAYTKR